MTSNTNLVVQKLLDQENEEYTYAKNNIKALIEAGMISLSELQDISQTSQHPRAFEALTELIKTLVDANKQLLDAKEVDTRINIAKTNGSYGPERIENNFVFHGTTAELQDFIEEKKKNSE